MNSLIIILFYSSANTASYTTKLTNFLSINEWSYLDTDWRFGYMTLKNERIKQIPKVTKQNVKTFLIFYDQFMSICAEIMSKDANLEIHEQLWSKLKVLWWNMRSLCDETDDYETKLMLENVRNDMRAVSFESWMRSNCLVGEPGKKEIVGSFKIPDMEPFNEDEVFCELADTKSKQNSDISEISKEDRLFLLRVKLRKIEAAKTYLKHNARRGSKKMKDIEKAMRYDFHMIRFIRNLVYTTIKENENAIDDVTKAALAYLVNVFSPVKDDIKYKGNH